MFGYTAPFFSFIAMLKLFSFKKKLGFVHGLPRIKKGSIFLFILFFIFVDVEKNATTSSIIFNLTVPVMI